LILDTYIAPLPDTTTQGRSQASHGNTEGLQGDVKFGRANHHQGMPLNGELIPCWSNYKQKARQWETR